MNRDEYLKLVKKMKEYDYHYYTLDNPIITDEEYDKLYKKIEEYEIEHPEDIVPDSPTRRVGYKTQHKFKKVEKHLYVVQETHYLRGKLFYEGDNVRVDSVSFQMLQESIDALKKVMKRPKEVIFYRWGNRDHYEPKKLQALLNAW